MASPSAYIFITGLHIFITVYTVYSAIYRLLYRGGGVNSMPEIIVYSQFFFNHGIYVFLSLANFLAIFIFSTHPVFTTHSLRFFLQASERIIWRLLQFLACSSLVAHLQLDGS
jgi:hypothetical protein